MQCQCDLWNFILFRFTTCRAFDIFLCFSWNFFASKKTRVCHFYNEILNMRINNNKNHKNFTLTTREKLINVSSFFCLLKSCCMMLKLRYHIPPKKKKRRRRWRINYDLICLLFGFMRFCSLFIAKKNKKMWKIKYLQQQQLMQCSISLA